MGMFKNDFNNDNISSHENSIKIEKVVEEKGNEVN